MMFNYVTLNDRQLSGLVESHCTLYQRRIQRAQEGAKGIRLDECQHLLDLWRSIGAKIQQGNWRLRLTVAEINEVRDALACGDFDAILAGFSTPS